MSTYSDHDQRLLDQQSGEEMDRQAERREAKTSKDQLIDAVHALGKAHEDRSDEWTADCGIGYASAIDDVLAILRSAGETSRDVADAERYRFLKDKLASGGPITYYRMPHALAFLREHTVGSFDDAVDKARQVCGCVSESQCVAKDGPPPTWIVCRRAQKTGTAHSDGEPV